MLKLAYSYQDKLNRAWEKCVFQERFKYYNGSSCWGYKIEVDDTSLNRIQMVSVDKNDEVVGYFSACVYREANTVTSIGAINFFSVNYTFSKDLFAFLENLFIVWGFDKIEWRVVVGNPAEKMYDKIVEKYNGRIVGVSRRAVKIHGGMYDEKLYEVFRDDYLANIKK